MIDMMTGPPQLAPQDLDALFMSAAAGYRLAVEEAQQWLERNGPTSTLGSEDMEKLGRLVDASLAQLGHQEEAAEQIRRIMRGEVGARSVGFHHLTPGEQINFNNTWNQKRDRQRQAELEWRTGHPSYRTG